jgi:dethiobiotin synthetase
MHLNTVNRFFVVGTDTEIGKTTVTRYLIQALQEHGKSAIGCKPIACGLNSEGHNEDVFIYEQINSLCLPTREINPICFDLPASPNIAAFYAAEEIDTHFLIKHLAKISMLPIDFIFYESCGGWYVPINDHMTMADIISSINLPILLVIGLQVGCINKALLTWEAILKSNLDVAGWIGNMIDPEIPALNQHIATIQKWISAPYLGTLPFQFENNSNQPLINIDHLINYVVKDTTPKTVN